MKLRSLLPIIGLMGLISWEISASAAVRVYGSASSSGELINVELYADISEPVVSFTAKLHYDGELLSPVSASKNENQWYISNGNQRAQYQDPIFSESGEVLIMGAFFHPSPNLVGVSGDGVLLGSVQFRRLYPKTPSFELSIGLAGSFASFVTANGERVESTPGEVRFDSVLPPGNDRDLDGLGDEWEREHFGDIESAFYSDDSDEDGVNNDGEERLGSDPNDPDSNLRLQIVHGEKVMRLSWDSFEGRRYTLLGGTTFDSFEVIEKGMKATPPSNNVELLRDNDAGLMFFRVLLEE